MPDESLTSVGPASRDILIRETPVMFVLPPEFGLTPRGFPLCDIVTLLNLVFQPSEPFNLRERRERDEVGEVPIRRT